MRGWLKEEAPENMKGMAVTDETSHSAMLPLKEEASRNMPDMSVTPDRSGTSTGECTMLAAPRKASSIEVHPASPHCTKLTSFWALAPVPSPSLILSKSPVIATL